MRRPSASTAIRAPKRRRALVGEQGVERGVVADLEGAVVAARAGRRRGRSAREVSGTSSALSRTTQAEEAVGGVDDREPGPAVAEEVLVERLLDADLAGDRDRFAVHHVGDADARSIRRVIAVCIAAPLAEPLIDEADQGQPDAAEDVAAGDASSRPPAMKR